MLIKITRVCDSSLSGFNHESRTQKSKNFLQNSDHRNMVVAFNSKDKQGFQPLRSHTRLQNYGKNTRKIIVHSVEPGASPPGPPSNILSWAVGVAVAIVIPFITYKWGPLIKSKVMGALQMAEDVAEAVEKAAEKVEKMAEEIVDDIPKDTKLREVVDFVEKIAERAADEAGAIDDFIDKLQEEEEEKAESPVNSLSDEVKKPPEDSKEEKPNAGN
ncbi:uncharacterized protein LOC131011773 isoform X1 [Salvia miltiorrhiza]|uniref:uncharacterized protein LOC131011773 isoform X1 n=1 Tax=Salvia miltiorrhiza TaxID=226208 RepID=UPI0025AD5B99|nr:uncharacterized protein LOC131011773 isoform X1 [Salvia miltiorrhiza]